MMSQTFHLLPKWHNYSVYIAGSTPPSSVVSAESLAQFLDCDQAHNHQEVNQSGRIQHAQNRASFYFFKMPIILRSLIYWFDQIALQILTSFSVSPFVFHYPGFLQIPTCFSCHAQYFFSPTPIFWCTNLKSPLYFNTGVELRVRSRPLLHLFLSECNNRLSG